MVEYFTIVPAWVWDWSGGILFLISLYFYFFKLPSAWHWSNASLVPYFIVFCMLELYMLAGLQVIYLMFGIHGLILWKLQERHNRWAPAWERLAVPFGLVIFGYTVYITQFADAWAWLQFVIVSLAIIGSVLLVLKKRSSWLVYIVSNVLGLVYFPHEGLWAMTFVQFAAALMSVYGYQQWKKDDEFIKDMREKKILA
jgi:nicotinamide mononucleotide transporter